MTTTITIDGTNNDSNLVLGSSYAKISDSKDANHISNVVSKVNPNVCFAPTAFTVTESDVTLTRSTLGNMKNFVGGVQDHGLKVGVDIDIVLVTYGTAFRNFMVNEGSVSHPLKDRADLVAAGISTPQQVSWNAIDDFNSLPANDQWKQYEIKNLFDYLQENGVRFVMCANVIKSLIAPSADSNGNGALSKASNNGIDGKDKLYPTGKWESTEELISSNNTDYSKLNGGVNYLSVLHCRGYNVISRN